MAAKRQREVAFPPLAGDPTAATEGNAPKKKKKKTQSEDAPPPPAAPSATRQRTQDSEHIPMSSTTTTNARYAHGFMQLPPTEQALVAREPPAPMVVFPPRHEQTLATLTPPQLKPIAQLVLDRASNSERTPHNILRHVYTPLMFARAARLLSDPRATPAEARAARIVAAVTGPELEQAQFGAPRILTGRAPQLLTAPTLKQQRSIRLVDPDVGPIAQTPAAPSAPMDTTRAAAVNALAATLVENKDKPVTAKHRGRARFMIERDAAFLSYYANDPEPDPSLSYGLPSSAYPMFTALQGEPRQTWESRYELLRDAGSMMPRVSIETTTRRYRERYRFPLSAFAPLEERRPCCRGLECRVHIAARLQGKEQQGYTPPEWFTPSEERAWIQRRLRGDPMSAEPPAGPCVECTDYAVTMRTTVFERSLKPPEQPINRTRVIVGEGEYARDVLIPWEIGGVRTGVEGYVPAYDLGYRQFGSVPIGPDKAARATVLCEVNVDFHKSLDQMNACLGVRKARPLAGVTGERWVSFPKDQPMLAVRDPAVWVSAAKTPADADAAAYVWHFYTRTLPLPMLADRALMLRAVARDRHPKTESGVVFTPTIPAVWLRHTALAAVPLRRTTRGEEEDVEEEEEKLAPCMQRALDDWMPPTTTQKLRELFQGAGTLSAALADLAAQAFTTFERSVAFLMTNPDHVLVRAPLLLFTQSARFGTWAQAAFEDASTLQYPPDWSAERPETWRSGQHRTWVLWTTCVWRIATALLFERIVQPLWRERGEDQVLRAREYSYMTHLFICTHVDFLTVFEALGTRASDAYWLQLAQQGVTEEPRFSRLYPQCARAACGDELPDGTPLRRANNPWYDMASKKTHASKGGALAHIEIKTAQHNCMTRGFDSVIGKAMARYTPIADLYTLIVRAALMGSYPRAQGRPELPALLRINAAFAPRTALLEGVTSAQEEAHRARIRLWLMRHPLITRNLLREHYVFTLERGGIYDDMFNQTRHWAMLKAVMRQCNTQIRRAVNAMVLHAVRHPREHRRAKPEVAAPFASFEQRLEREEKGEERMGAPIGWDTLEYRPRHTSFGEIQRWHERQKDHNTKLFKAPELVLLARKMTPVESKLARYGYTVEAARAFLAEEQRGETLHIMAYLAAHQMHAPLEDGHSLRPALPTGLLKIVGMSRESHVELRQWLHGNVEYHSADDSFLHLVTAMAERNWRDFVLFKVYTSLVEFYGDYVISFASAEHTRHQWMALRASLGLSRATVAPPRLGRAHFCECCNKWGHAIARPSREYLGLVPKLAGATDSPVPRPGGDDTAALAEEPLWPEKTSLVDVQHNLVTTKAQILQKYKLRHRARPYEPRPVHQADGQGACFTRVMYNPLDTQLYCTGGTKMSGLDDVIGEDDDDDEADDEGEEEEEEGSEDERATRKRQKKRKTDKDKQQQSKGGNPKKPDLARVLLSMFPTCQHQPMVAMDLIGVYKRLQKRMYTLCSYCGCKCEAIASNMTNMGISCGEHALVDEYPRWHRIWRHIIRPPDSSSPTAQARATWKHLLPRPCMWCGHHDLKETAALWVYDARYALKEVHLCRFHMARARFILPRAAYGEQLVPVPLAALREQLASAMG